MNLQQQGIRNAFVAAVTLGVGPVSAHPTGIFRSPRRALGRKELPATCIFSVSDRAVDENADHTVRHQRVYSIRAEVRLENLNEEDSTDPYADAIRQAVYADDTLGGLCYRIVWAEQAWGGEEGEWPIAGTALDFHIFYSFQP